MDHCKYCRNCKCKIPLIRKDEESFFESKLDYENAEIRCISGHWMKCNGDEFVYKNLDRFYNKSNSNRVNALNCPDFLSFRGQPKKHYN
jgi:hypothetical protein